MPFDPAAIASVSAVRDGTELHLSWAAAAPGAWYQVYVNRSLAWRGTATQLWLPWPPAAAGPLAITVGAVDAADRDVDFSGSLPPLTDRCLISWEGGTYEDQAGRDDVAGWRIHAGAPGSPVDYARPLASVEAYPAGVITDGFGLGPFGHGGFGKSAGNYSWPTGHLSPGVWTFAVCACDAAGNVQNPGTLITFAASGPPRPPAADARGVRLHSTYDPATRRATLTWLASPP